MNCLICKKQKNHLVKGMCMPCYTLYHLHKKKYGYDDVETYLKLRQEGKIVTRGKWKR